MDSPSESGDVTDQQSVTSGSHKLTKDEEEYLDKLLAEKRIVDAHTNGLDCTQKLINSEIERLLSGSLSSGVGGSKRFCDVTKDKPIKVTVRTSVPTREHPKFNFVGKLLGPKGNSLKRLQEETLTKMAILGRGSMRDKHKEEEYRHSHEPRYKHLSDDLHVEITAYAAPAEAHARIALALTEIRRFLVPDYNDDIRQEQLREMQMMIGGVGGQHQLQQQQQQGDEGSSSTSAASVRNVSGGAGGACTTMTLTSANGVPSIHHHHHLSTTQGAMGAPLRAVSYPPVLPLMHPALRGLCKPSLVGLTAGSCAMMQTNSGAASLLNRYRPPANTLLAGPGPTGPPQTACGLVANLNHHQQQQQQQQQQQRRPTSGDFGESSSSSVSSSASDPASTAGFLELYHRYRATMQQQQQHHHQHQQPNYSDGSDGIGSPLDERDEGSVSAGGDPSDLFMAAAVAAAAAAAAANGVGTTGTSTLLMDGPGGAGSAAASVVAGNNQLKMTPSGMERTRYRHDPYARYSTPATKVLT